MDYFEQYQLLPLYVQRMVDALDVLTSSEDFDFAKLRAMQQAFNALGYDFEYGLDLQPFNLKPYGNT